MWTRSFQGATPRSRSIAGPELETLRRDGPASRLVSSRLLMSSPAVSGLVLLFPSHPCLLLVPRPPPQWAAMDEVTSLPLSHGLLAFYRDKLRDALRQSHATLTADLERIQPDLDHVHQLERSLASSVLTIRSFEGENTDLRDLLRELIEDNARLRLNTAPSSSFDFAAQSDRLVDLLQTSQGTTTPDHAPIIDSLVERCTSLEGLGTRLVSDLQEERLHNEQLAMRVTELEATLAHTTDALTKELGLYASQPSLHDFECLKSQTALLQGQAAQDAKTMTVLRNENSAMRRQLNGDHRPTTRNSNLLRPLTLNTLDVKSDMTGCRRHRDDTHIESGPEHDNYTETNIDLNDDCLDNDIVRLSEKLKSLERFALRFMPASVNGNETYGVPEFFRTVDKSKGRVSEIEERLARRIEERHRRH